MSLCSILCKHRILYGLNWKAVSEHFPSIYFHDEWFGIQYFCDSKMNCWNSDSNNKTGANWSLLLIQRIRCFNRRMSILVTFQRNNYEMTFPTKKTHTQIVRLSFYSSLKIQTCLSKRIHFSQNCRMVFRCWSFEKWTESEKKHQQINKSIKKEFVWNISFSQSTFLVFSHQNRKKKCQIAFYSSK